MARPTIRTRCALVGWSYGRSAARPDAGQPRHPGHARMLRPTGAAGLRASGHTQAGTARLDRVVAPKFCTPLVVSTSDGQRTWLRWASGDHLVRSADDGPTRRPRTAEWLTRACDSAQSAGHIQQLLDLLDVAIIRQVAQVLQMAPDGALGRIGLAAFDGPEQL